MSKYNSYMTRLDEAFRTARSQFEEVVAELEAAQAAVRSAGEYHQEKYYGENAARKASADARLMAAKAKMDNAKRTIWPEYERTAAQLTRELEAEIRKDNIATPDAIDANGLELLKSGVMGADDFEGMAERYNNNPTMLKMVAKYAEEKASSMAHDTAQAHERARLTHVAMTARGGRSVRLQDWDNILDIAKRCAGIRYDGRIDYRPSMAENWDKWAAKMVDQF